MSATNSNRGIYKNHPGIPHKFVSRDHNRINRSTEGFPIVLVTDYSETLEAGSLCNLFPFEMYCIVPGHDHQFVRRDFLN